MRETSGRVDQKPNGAIRQFLERHVALVEGLLAFLTLFVLAVVCIALANRAGRSVLQSDIEEEVISAAEVAARQIDVKGLTDSNSASQVRDHAFRTLQAKLEQIRAAEPRYAHIFTVHRTSTGMRVGVSVGDPATDPESKLGLVRRHHPRPNSGQSCSYEQSRI